MGEATGEFWGTDSKDEQGKLSSPDGEWTFSYDRDQLPVVSSGIKHIYIGVFERKDGTRPQKARALVFVKNFAGSFGSECASLSMLSSLGVGPKLLAISQGKLGGATVAAPIIIEEDVGQSLASLLSACEHGGSILHEIGTPEREQENAKIMYDLFVQVINAHAAGIYHRDLRCENVCVSRFGEAPADIRATLVDFDLGTSQRTGNVAQSAPLYYTLFYNIPLMLGTMPLEPPTALELDMGYLAALQYHLHMDALVLNGLDHESEALMEFVDYLGENTKYFGYVDHLAHPYARELSLMLDVDELGRKLGLTRVDEKSFPSRQLRELAQSFQRPYLDGRDLREIGESPEATIAACIDEIARAKFATYNGVKAEIGKDIEYLRLEDQPADFIRSTYEQAEHMTTKIRALGYRIVPLEQADSHRVVSELSADQIEALARLEHFRFLDERFEAGWVLDRTAPKSDPARKVSPNLVSYDELEDETRNYNRNEAREIIPLLRSVGLVVVRA